MTRVGVVGVGMMGQHHVRVYSELGCKVVGIVDKDVERAKELAAKYGTTVFPDYASLIPHVDAVTIAVPTSVHRRVALDFLAAGVHCLVEKPIASNPEEGAEMVRAAADRHAILMIGHIERFNPAVARLKTLLEQERLGKLMIISTRRVGPFVPRIRDVGIIVDSATHDIDVTRYLIGSEPASVFCRAGRFQHEKEDHAVVVLDFGGTTACIEVNWFTPHKVRTLVATGSKGIAYLDYIKPELTICNSHDNEQVAVQKVEPLRLELEHFLRCVAGNEKPLVDGSEGLKVLRIALEASQLSRETVMRWAMPQGVWRV